MTRRGGRVVTLPRRVEPRKDVALLIDQLGLTLPVQPPPKVTGELAATAKPRDVVKT